MPEEKELGTPEDRAALAYAYFLIKDGKSPAEAKRVFGSKVENIEHIIFSAIYRATVEDYDPYGVGISEWEPYSEAGHDLLAFANCVIGKRK